MEINQNEMKLKEIENKTLTEMSSVSINTRSEILRFAFIKYNEHLKNDNFEIVSHESFEIKHKRISFRWIFSYSLLFCLVIKEAIESYLRPNTNIPLMFCIVFIYIAIFVILIKKFYLYSPLMLVRKYIQIENKKILKNLNK